MPRHSEETKQKAREMRAAGMSYIAIGKVIGASKDTIRLWCDAEAQAKLEDYRKANSERIKEYMRDWRSRNPDYQKEWYEENREASLAYSAQWRADNAERVKQTQAEYRANNRERRNAQSTEYRNKNRAKMRALWSAYTRNHPEKNATKSSKRRATQLQATPPWYTAEHDAQIEALHVERRRMNAETGRPHHVDHIIPLVAKAMVDGKWIQVACGLHVPWNLRVMPGADNCRKSFKLPRCEDWTA